MTAVERQLIASLKDEIASIKIAKAGRNGDSSWSKVWAPIAAGIGATLLSTILNYNLTIYRLGEVETLAKATAKDVHQQELTVTKLGTELLASAKATENQANEARKATDANTTTVALIKAGLDKVKEDCESCGSRRSR